VTAQSLSIASDALSADRTGVYANGPPLYVADLEVIGVASVTSTGIMLTGASQTAVKSLQAHDVFASTQVTTNGNLNGQSLTIATDALKADSGGVIMNGPSASIANLVCGNLTGGTGSFQSLLVAGTQSAFHGNVSVGGTISGTGLWSGVATIAQSLALPQYAMASSYTSSSTYLHLGTWTAPIGGHVLKLNYLSCCGFNVNQAVSSTYPGTITTYGRRSLT
jgi:hypothetical protein